jgi:hypothetical protein
LEFLSENPCFLEEGVAYDVEREGAVEKEKVRKIVHTEREERRWHVSWYA